MNAKELREALNNVPDDFEIRLQVDQFIRGSIDHGSRRVSSNVTKVEIGDGQRYKRVWLFGTEER